MVWLLWNNGTISNAPKGSKSAFLCLFLRGGIIVLGSSPKDYSYWRSATLLLAKHPVMGLASLGGAGAGASGESEGGIE